MKDLSSAMQDAGFSISDTPPVQETQQQNVEQTESSAEQAAPTVEEQPAQPETEPTSEPRLVDEPPVESNQELF